MADLFATGCVDQLGDWVVDRLCLRLREGDGDQVARLAGCQRAGNVIDAERPGAIDGRHSDGLLSGEAAGVGLNAFGQ